MALVNWDDSLSVGVAEFDKQHKEIIVMINALNDALETGKGKDVLTEIVDGLIASASTHFETEEKYFVKYGYPDSDNHKMEHDALARKVSDFKDGLAKNKLALTTEVTDFLSDWLENHVEDSDKKYSKFLNEKGLR